jgi:hypothetical protein
LTCSIQPVLRSEILSTVLSDSLNMSLDLPRSSQTHFSVYFINFVSAHVVPFRFVAFYLQLIKASVKLKYYRNAFRFLSGLLTLIMTRSRYQNKNIVKIFNVYQKLLNTVVSW